MQESIIILSHFSNFLPKNALIQITHPNIQSQLECLSEFAQIQMSLQQYLLTSQLNQKQLFLELSEFIIVEEQNLGPKKFKVLIQTIITILIDHSVKCIHKSKIQKAILILTYSQKYCGKYLNSFIKIIINLTFALVHLFNDSIRNIQAYLQNAKFLFKYLNQSQKKDLSYEKVRTLIMIYQGLFYNKTNYVLKSKNIFTQILVELTNKISQQRKKKTSLNLTTKYFFIVSTSQLQQIYRKMNNKDLQSYYRTQFVCFSIQQMPELHDFIQIFTKDHILQAKSVKISRIQNKLQKVKELHKINYNIKLQNHKQVKKQTIFLIKSRKSIHGKAYNTAQIKNELKNLFVLAQKSENKLKHRTLRKLNQQRKQKQIKMDFFCNQLEIFEKEKENLQEKFQIIRHQTEITQNFNYTIELMEEVKNRKWQVVGKLKQTSKIQSYLKGLVTSVFYEKNNKFSKLFYGQKSFKLHLLLFTFYKKIKSKIQRIHIKSIYLKEVRHQLQFYQHKITKQNKIKIYQIEPGNGFQAQFNITQELSQRLRNQPFLFYFEFKDQKIVSIQQYLSQLKQTTMVLCMNFIKKLKVKVLLRKNIQRYEKSEINITFGRLHTEMIYVMFVRSIRKNDSYTHYIQRIDNKRYNCEDFNIKFSKQFVSNQKSIQKATLVDMMTQQLLERRRKYINYILKIQSYFRHKLAYEQYHREREKINVSCAIINNNIFSLVQKQGVKYFFIQNLQKKHPKIVVKYVQYTSLSFVNKLREQLSKTQVCSQQLNIINNFFRLRSFADKFIKKCNEIRLDSNFSSLFKKSLCFAKITKQILYRGKIINARAMFMLIVKNFDEFPRPYLLRIFNLQSNSLFSFDYQKIVFNNEKMFLQKNLDKINQLVDIQGTKSATILVNECLISIKKTKRSNNSKSTLFSNFSFSSEDFKDLPKQPRISGNFNARLSSRQSIVVRNKKNSITYKMRHKSALKQKDVVMIRKWIEQSKQNSYISESSESSES